MVLGLYGISQTGLPLENIGTLKSTVSQVKTVNPEETVGYNRKGEVLNESRIAVVPMGYADGLDRKLGNKNGSAFVGGVKSSDYWKYLHGYANVRHHRNRC